RASGPLMSPMRARGPRSLTTASDKDRVRHGPGDLGLLADLAPADRGTRRLLQHDRRAVGGTQHVTTAFAREHRLGDGDAHAVLRRVAVQGIGEAQPLGPRRQRYLGAAGGPSGAEGAD